MAQSGFGLRVLGLGLRDQGAHSVQITITHVLQNRPKTQLMKSMDNKPKSNLLLFPFQKFYQV